MEPVVPCPNMNRTLVWVNAAVAAGESLPNICRLAVGNMAMFPSSACSTGKSSLCVCDLRVVMMIAGERLPSSAKKRCMTFAF